MTSSFPTHSPSLSSPAPTHEGRGGLHLRTASLLTALGMSAPTGLPSPHEADPPSDSSSLSLPRGARAVLTWTGEAGGPADELTLQASCGLMAVHGRRAGRPHALPYDYVSTVSATAHLTALFAAELARLRSGSPTTVRTRADSCALVTVSQYLAAATVKEGEAVPTGPGTATFTSADGVDFEIEALNPEPWGSFWECLRAPSSAIAGGWTPFQFRYATACSPLPPELARTAAETPWERVLRAAESSGVGLVRVTADRPKDRVVPWRLRPLGFGSGGAAATGPISELPLSGLKVLEAGRRIQAPLAARLLRFLGADVVRVEPPGGDPLRGMPPMCGDLSARWSALNHDKDAVEVDIKSATGRSELLELVRETDVFLHNWAPGKAEQLGLCADSMGSVAPNLVHAHTSGWGDDWEGEPPGTDFMVQARTGLTGPAPEGAGSTVSSLMTVLDVLGGFLGAQAVTAALAHRERHGGGQAVESSLLGAARLLASSHHTGEAQGGYSGRGLPTPTAGGGSAPVERLEDLEHDPRVSGLLHRTRNGVLAVRSPWEVS